MKPTKVNTSETLPTDQPATGKVDLPWETKGTLASSIYDLGRLVTAMRMDFRLDTTTGAKLVEIMLQYHLNLKLSSVTSAPDIGDIFKPEVLPPAVTDEPKKEN